ncbi:MAG: hypothetical protein ACFFA5_01395 [Promethearchaeota archaeon]
MNRVSLRFTFTTVSLILKYITEMYTHAVFKVCGLVLGAHTQDIVPMRVLYGAYTRSYYVGTAGTVTSDTTTQYIGEQSRKRKYTA